MPVTLATFAAGEMVMKYHEPYVTQGLNQKMAYVVPPGIFRGFKLATAPLNNQITIKADPESLDHVANYTTAAGYSVTIRRATGDFIVDLTAELGNGTVVICLYTTYSLGSTTTGIVQALTLAEYAASPYGPTGTNELIVLGQVAVPGSSGAITLADLTHTGRTSAWANVANEQVSWAPLIRNSSFEYGATGLTYQFATPFWEADTNVDFNWSLINTAAHTGTQCLQLLKTATGSSITGQLSQRVNIPVSPGSATTGAYPGQLLKVSVWVQQLFGYTSGAIALYVEWGDLNGNVLSTSTVSLLAAVPTIDPAWRQVTQTLTVPANAVVIRRIGITTTSYASLPGATFIFDDLQCWLETNNPLVTELSSERQIDFVAPYPMSFVDPASPLNDIAAIAHFDHTLPNTTEGQITIERRDQATGTAVPPAISQAGRMFIGAGLLGNTANAILPRLSLPASNIPSTYTLISESIATSVGDGATRVFTFGTDGSQVITENASWNGTIWTQGNSGSASTKFVVSPSGISYYTQASFTSTWNDASWVLVWNSTATQALITSLASSSAVISASNSGSGATVSTAATGAGAALNATATASTAVTVTGSDNSAAAMTITASGTGNRGLISTTSSTGAAVRAVSTNIGSGVALEVTSPGTGTTCTITNSDLGTALAVTSEAGPTATFSNTLTGTCLTASASSGTAFTATTTSSGGVPIICAPATGWPAIKLTPTATPTGSAAGQLYVDSTSNSLQLYNGTQWTGHRYSLSGSYQNSATDGSPPLVYYIGVGGLLHFEGKITGFSTDGVTAFLAPTLAAGAAYSPFSLTSNTQYLTFPSWDSANSVWGYLKILRGSTDYFFYCYSSGGTNGIMDLSSVSYRVLA